MSSDADPQLAALFQRVQLNPGSAEALHQYGNALRDAGRLDDAVFRLEQALKLAPAEARIWDSLGLTLGQLGRWNDAAGAYQRAIAHQADSGSAHNNLGIALLEMGKFAEAIDCFRACLRLMPDCVEAHNNLGVALANLSQHEDALRCFQAALALRPESAESHLGLGAALSELGRDDESMRHFQEALRLKPDAANVHNDAGIACAALLRFDEALAHFDKALLLRPDYPMARKNRGLAWLVQGDYARGWEEYEQRLLDRKLPQRHFQQPRWDGSPLEGKTILIYHEQGLGDTIQFVRYLPLVKERGGRVVFECQAPLAKLLALCPGIDVLVPARAPLPPFDVQAPLMSLPYIFGTNSENIPAPVPYVFADDGLLRLWGPVLAHLDGIRVGIAWQGNPQFKKDRQRSIPLRHFAPLAQLPGVRLFSLQRGAGTEQLASAGFPVLDLGADLDRNGAFTDTAAILKNLDLVVTSDTAIAHLAGALGVPVWLALPLSPDWRWLLEREDCPWYPTMRLFRQKRRGEWAEVFARMASELARSHKRPRLLAESEAGNRAGCGYVEASNRAGCGYDVAANLLRLGNALAGQNQHEEAAGCFREVLRLDPESAEAEGGLGLSCQSLGRNADSVTSLERCLALHPNQAGIHCSLGVALYRLQRFDEAIAHYRQALRLKPDYADAHNNLGNAYRAAGQLDAASASLRQAIRLRPNLPESHYLLGEILFQQGKLEEAADAFSKAIKHRPGYFSAHLQRGNALASLGKHDDAISSLRQAARLDPGNGEVPFRLGNSLRLAGKAEEAIAAYRESIRINPAVIEVWPNLGVALTLVERFEEAEAAYRQGLRLQPQNADLINNLGLALKNQQRLDESLACFAEALRLAPRHVEAHHNRGMTLLSRGDLKQGWPEYEWRLQRQDRSPLRLAQPRWDGSSLAGRTILLYPEQGIGDFIQFVRYAALLKAQGARVLLLCPSSLAPLMRCCAGIDELIVQGSPLPPFDVQASLMSLPLLLGTTLDTIPADVPYLSADAGLIERWGQLFGRLDGFKVGIGWQGNPQFVADRGRSIPLHQFAPLAQIADVQLISLQRGPGVEQLATVDFPILSFDRQADEAAGAFMDTAAIMQQLDLVITSDTALAHLAGAMGVPVWVVLGAVPDWRWLLEREDCPWYPSMRLFRQQHRGDWAPVFERVAEALRDEAARKASVSPIMAPVSAGELIDKITILEIKAERISDPLKLSNVRHELALLREAQERAYPHSEERTRLTSELRAVNVSLWQIEDDLRLCEAAGDFGARFIELARSVYKVNEHRGDLKRSINELLGSRIIEEKCYADWQRRDD